MKPSAYQIVQFCKWYSVVFRFLYTNSNNNNKNVYLLPILIHVDGNKNEKLWKMLRMDAFSFNNRPFRCSDGIIPFTRRNCIDSSCLSSMAGGISRDELYSIVKWNFGREIVEKRRKKNTQNIHLETKLLLPPLQTYYRWNRTEKRKAFTLQRTHSNGLCFFYFHMEWAFKQINKFVMSLSHTHIEREKNAACLPPILTENCSNASM